MKRLVLLGVLCLALTGCARSPDDELNQLKLEVARAGKTQQYERTIERIEAMVKVQNDKFFKNFDPVREEINKARGTLEASGVPSESNGERTVYVSNYTGGVSKVTIEGHDYLVFSNNTIHSASCRCGR